MMERQNGSSQPRTAEAPQKPESKSTQPFLIAIVVIVSFAAYFNALFNDFVYDDIAQILQNPWLRDIKNIPEIMSRGVWEFEADKISNYYRPMMHVIFTVNYYLFGVTPWGYHLLNILSHAGVSVLVFFVLCNLFKESQSPSLKSFLSPPFTAAVLFAVHPIHTEAVTWVSALPEVSYAFFFLLSLYFYMRFKTADGRPFRKGLYIISLASFSLALLCKEPAITLPVLIIAYDVTFWKAGPRTQSQLKFYIPYFIIIMIYVMIRFYALKGFAPMEGAVPLGGYLFSINVFPLFIRYMEKLIFPFGLNVFYVFHPAHTFLDFKVIASIVLTGAFAGITYVAFRKNRIVFFSLLFVLVPLLPSLYIFGLGGVNVFAERYLYLPSFGFVVLLSLFLDRVRGLKSGGIPAVALFLAVGLVYGAATLKRNPVWKDSYTLWSDAVEKSPDSALVHQNLGYALLYHKGRSEEAKEHLKIAARLDPKLVDNMTKKSIALARKGLFDKAILGFHTVLILVPDSAPVRYNLGLAYESKGWTKQAMEQYEIALQLDPDSADAHNNLGIIYGNRGAIDKAIEHFQKAIQSKPNDPYAYYNLANAYHLKGLTEKAVEYKRKAESLRK